MAPHMRQQQRPRASAASSDMVQNAIKQRLARGKAADGLA